jgi:hypothetical protein
VSRLTVSPRAGTRRADRGGDPLDGLVNLFDVGIVLAIAFLLAALSSMKLDDLLTAEDVTVIRSDRDTQTLIVRRDQQVRTIELEGRRVVGEGERIGAVYRLSDGRTVFVERP